MPETTLKAFSDHGEIGSIMPADGGDCEKARAGDSFTPSNAVVVPDDSGAPVQIILESSTDLVTWTAALPGTYGTY